MNGLYRTVRDSMDISRRDTHGRGIEAPWLIRPPELAGVLWRPRDMVTGHPNGETVGPSERTPGGSNFEASTRSLVRRGLLGDRWAFERLFERILPGLRRWVHGRLPRRARGTGDTADIVQDAAMRVWRQLGSLRVDRSGDLEAYIRQAARNRIRDEARRLGRRPDDEPINLDLPEDSPSPLEQVLGQELFNRQRESFSRLAPDEREILIARFEFGYKYEQIAALMGKPSAAAARMAVNRLLERLRGQADGGRSEAFDPSEHSG
jgi:RNA polymerase sigma-70 factor, ECF subfamily